MIYVPTFLLGMSLCYLLWVWNERSRDLYVLELELKVADRDFEKEMLLDFGERQQRQIESLEAYETELSKRLFYAERKAERMLTDSVPIYEEGECCEVCGGDQALGLWDEHITVCEACYRNPEKFQAWLAKELESALDESPDFERLPNGGFRRIAK